MGHAVVVRSPGARRGAGVDARRGSGFGAGARGGRGAGARAGGRGPGPASPGRAPVPENPALEVNGGYRRAEDDFLDFEAAVSQDLYAGRQRTARLAGTGAALERAEAELDEARRRLVQDVGAAFVRSLGARDRAVLLARSREAADGLLAAF